MKPIRMVDLEGQYLKIKEEIDSAIQEVIDSTIFIGGEQVKSFGQELADYCNVPHVIPCANGTDALQIAMMALDLQPGDEVILPVWTYVATAEVIALLRLKPVFVDVEPDYFNIDPNKIEELITDRTRCIVPVHLYGQCADMEPILRIAQKHQLYVIEDTAQAIGADYTFSDGDTMKAGTMSQVGTTSFFPSKNLGCYGDGGAMIVPDDELAAQIRVVANHGQTRRYYHDFIGVNSRLDAIQAAVLRQKLPHLDEYAAARNKVASSYDEAFADIDRLITPKRDPKSTHVFHQYTMKTSGIDRNHMQSWLAEKEVPSMIYYPVPLHKQKAYEMYNTDGRDFEVSNDLADRVISLPVHTEMQDDQLAHIIDCVQEYFKTH